MFQQRQSYLDPAEEGDAVFSGRINSHFMLQQLICHLFLIKNTTYLTFTLHDLTIASKSSGRKVCSLFNGRINSHFTLQKHKGHFFIQLWPCEKENTTYLSSILHEQFDHSLLPGERSDM